jgi:hypothetical protein
VAKTKKLKKWACYGVVTGGKYLGEFEAATEAEAVEMAELSDAASPTLCHQCASECEDPQVSEVTATEVTRRAK